MTLQKKQNNKLVSPRDLSETRFSFNHPTNQDSAGIQTTSPVSVTSEWEFTSPSLTSECDSSSSEGRSLHPAGSHSRPRDLLWRRGRARQEHSGDGERERVWIKASRWDSHSFSLWSETERWRDGGRVSFLSLHLTLERLSLSVSQSASFYHHLSLLSVISPSSSLTPCISLFSLLSTFSFTRLLLFTVTVQPEPLRLKLLSADSIYHPSLFQLSSSSSCSGVSTYFWPYSKSVTHIFSPSLCSEFRHLNANKNTHLHPSVASTHQHIFSQI